MSIPLEDTVADIIGKAQRGLGLSDSDLARQVGIEVGELDAVKQVRGVAPEKVSKLATALELDPHALLKIAEGTYQPTTSGFKTGFLHVSTAYSEILVNSYLVWDAESGAAAAFDTGADCGPLLSEMETRNLRLRDVYLTHTHTDHILELDRLVEKSGGRAQVHVNAAEALDRAISFKPGMTFSLGRLQIETRETSGHSAGGTSYLIHGLDRPLTIVGDALFAGSVGGIKSNYHASLKLIRDNVLSGQDGTVIAPGHGPLTTVIQEKANNPFFASSTRA